MQIAVFHHRIRLFRPDEWFVVKNRVVFEELERLRIPAVGRQKMRQLQPPADRRECFNIRYRQNRKRKYCWDRQRERS